jgi:hypothetical protein
MKYKRALYRQVIEVSKTQSTLWIIWLQTLWMSDKRIQIWMQKTAVPSGVRMRDTWHFGRQKNHLSILIQLEERSILGCYAVWLP